MLNIQRLWLLQQLASAGTISRVAELEGLTRPAVSQQLAQFERETSLVLIERAGRGVRLTSSALELLGSAKPLFTALSEVEGHLEAQRKGIAGELRICAFASATFSLLPNAMRLIKEQMPQLALSLVELEPAEAFQGIASNRLDLAVVDEISMEPESAHHFDHEPYLVDHLFAVLPEYHPLVNLERLDLKMLEKESWLLSNGASRFTNSVIEECHRVGFDPLVVARCNQVATILELIRHGFGVTVLPGLSLTAQTHGLAVLPLQVPIVRRIHIAYRRGRRKQAVISTAIDALHESVGMLEENL